jgi:hypothetical protein
MLHVRCPRCGAEGWTEDGSNPDAAVRCTSPAGDPPGSVDGCCSTLGHTHEEHAEYVRATGDARSRPVIITAFAHLSGEAASD